MNGNTHHCTSWHRNHRLDFPSGFRQTTFVVGDRNTIDIPVQVVRDSCSQPRHSSYRLAPKMSSIQVGELQEPGNFQELEFAERLLSFVRACSPS
jgi:hypothetical protein